MESVYGNTEERPSPTDGKVQGAIPDWLSGNLYRNGPGLFTIGDTKYKHLFDGLAILHHFNIQNGRVSYKSKYIRSETYKRNTQANRIVTSEFGTNAYPDPCKNIFQRLFAWFQPEKMSDNTLVTVTPYGDYLYSAAETNVIHQLHPDTLDTLAAIDISEKVAVSAATAHYHRDRDGSLHNIGLFRQGRPQTRIIRVPPPSADSLLFERAEVVASVPVRWSFHPSYIHSFGMTENYYVFVDQPLCVDLKTLMLSKFTNQSYADCLKWYDEYKCVFHILDKRTGREVNPGTSYMADPFFVFHHINTYEDGGFLVVDLCSYDNADIIHSVYLDELRLKTQTSMPKSTPRRYVLPLDVTQGGVGENCVTLENSSAKAVMTENGSILCQCEDLNSEEALELPQINYERYNGQKYRYVYGVSGSVLEKLVKIDTETKSAILWEEDEVNVSEPIFVSTPGATTEDDGVLLAVLHKTAHAKSVTYLLVLDASSMNELGRVEFDFRIASDIHGVFVEQISSKDQ